MCVGVSKTGVTWEDWDGHMGRCMWHVSCPVESWGLDLELRGTESRVNGTQRVPIETQGGASIPLIHDK